ncbi:MAG: glycosyltransferase family 39 protein [candidate division NC10 bacterium]
MSTPPSPAPSETAAAQRRPVGRATAILLGLAALTILVALARNGRYGYFIDELYYVACSEHLAWGYVDQPPLSVVLLALSRAIFGDATWALRLLPALATATAVILTGLMARRLGGGTFAQALAALAAVVSPMYLIFASAYSMNHFDLLFWTLGAYVILGILKNDDPKGWLLFGLIAGLGLQNKLSMAFFGFGLCVALVLTRNRKYIVSKVDGKFRPGLYLWGGGALAVLIFCPFLIWQALNDWPTIEWVGKSNAAYGNSPLVVLLSQLAVGHPFPIALVGLYFYLFSRRGRPYRMMGIIYVSILILFVMQNAKSYYLAVAYPMLFAGGAVLIESFAEHGYRRALKPVIVTALVVITGLRLPFILPVLPPKQLLAYQESLGLPSRGQVPLGLADRLGAEELATEVARVYETLPEEDRKESVILAGTYLEAAAIDFFGKKYGLPPATSYHNNYYLWGPGDTSWGVVIAVWVGKDRLEDMFGEVVEAGRMSCEYCRPRHQDLPIYVCRKPKRPIAEVWAEWKHFI